MHAHCCDRLEQSGMCVSIRQLQTPRIPDFRATVRGWVALSARGLESTVCLSSLLLPEYLTSDFPAVDFAIATAHLYHLPTALQKS